MVYTHQVVFTAVACLLAASSCEVAQGDVISFQASDFGVTPTFSDVQTFDFAIDIGVLLTAGTTYVNPTLNGVVYNVSGALAMGTPSGFPAFALERTIGGAEFYSQGSSLSFTIDAAADLSDGLQVSDLSGTDPVFVFNGREVDTGRYHPALLELNADGTGSIRNSNNFGGTNPSSGLVVDVDFGEEYITNLTFDPANLTLVQTVSVPEPTSASFLIGITGLAFSRRRRSRG